MAHAKPPSDLNIPFSDHIVEVSIIDTTSHVEIPAALFMEPLVPGHEMLQGGCYAFLIKHKNPEAKSKYDTMLFDLGIRKDWENSPKSVVERFTGKVTVTVEKDVLQILKEHGEDPREVGGIIWSHYHWDHTGDTSTFPTSTDLIVGPGFKEAFVPGFPTVEDSPVAESAYKDRHLREIDFNTDSKGLKLGQLRAFDFYGDGSFYLLDTPGHAIGHMCGLARTSSDPPEFIFMGGDIAHWGGEYRPTQYIPLPENIVPSPFVAAFSGRAHVCPGSLFEEIHPKRSRTEPFYVPTTKGVHQDAEVAKDSIDKMTEFDAHDGIFVHVAHDSSLDGVVDYFPKTANGWSKKHWKEEGRWRFLRDLPVAFEEHKAT